MAREIVITSVPRGVKLGRTGFQVAMQTAGMRDDLASQLEKMAGYRHLPAGVPNPVCYFHRITKTFAGQVCVLGRIVDAGVDFSNRSNKLAHMVVLEAADVGQVASSSPAAALAALEGRLANAWPGPPEERREPVNLAVIPASQAARCGLWQQVMGDAGWAGVLAERAERGQPTLVIGPNSSPASCRQMLALFQEALALLPVAKRWSVTFDTTSLSPEGVLWRGTYAGSPESQAAQPGVLVVDLTRPQPIPQNLVAGDFVKIAREGPQAPVMPRPGPATGTRTPEIKTVEQKVQSGGGSTGGGKQPVMPGGGGGTPPPPPIDDQDRVFEERTHRPSRSKSLMGWIIGLVLTFVGLLLVGGGVVVFIARAHRQHQAAIEKFCTYAESDRKPNEPVPTEEDLACALGYGTRSEDAKSAAESLPFLNAWLKSEEGTRKSVENKAALQKILKAVEAVRSKESKDRPDALKLLVPGRGNGLYQTIAKANEQGCQEWPKLREQFALAAIVGYANKDKASPAPSAVDYRYALGREQGTEVQPGFEKTALFLNDVLSHEDFKGDHVATTEKLKSLWEAVASLQKERPKDRGRQGLDVLVRSDKESVKLLDEIHPKPFATYDVFRNLVSDIAAVMELAKKPSGERKDTDRDVVRPALWNVIVDHAGIAVDKENDEARTQFAKSVVETDLASGQALITRVGGSRRVEVENNAPVPASAPASGQEGFPLLQANIQEFKKQRRNVAAELDGGKEVVLFDTAGVQIGFQQFMGLELRVGTCKPRFEPSLQPSLAVTVGSDEVLVFSFSDQKLKVKPGSKWSEHRQLAKFMPIALAYKGEVRKDDWFVLASPDSESLTPGKRTLRDLLCNDDTDKGLALKLPPELRNGSLRLAKRSFQIDENPILLDFQLQDGHATRGVLRFSAVIPAATMAKTDQLSQVTYSFDLPVTLKTTSLSKESRSWCELQSRLKNLQRQNGLSVTEPDAFGFKAGSGDKPAALRGVITLANATVLVQAAVTVWSKTNTPYNDASKSLKAWGVTEEVTLEELRKTLENKLRGDKSDEGFAAFVRKRFTNMHVPPSDEAGKDAIESYSNEREKHVHEAIQSPKELRSYLQSKNVQGRLAADTVSSDLVAVITLLELDGLVVSKVYRKHLESLLNRIPVEALVEGDAGKRSWSVEGLEGQAEATVKVQEVRFSAADILPPVSPKADVDSPPADSEAESSKPEGDDAASAAAGSSSPQPETTGTSP